MLSKENIDEFEKVFDFREMRKLAKSEEYNYTSDQIIKIATDSGGYSCGGLYWVKKDAKPSIDRMIENKENDIKRLENQLEFAKQDLERLLENAN